MHGSQAHRGALRQPTGPSGDCQGHVRGEDSGRTRQSRPSVPGGVHLRARMRVPFGGRSLSWGYAPVSGSRCPGVSYSHVATRGDIPRRGPASATAWISVLDLSGEGAQRPGAQVKAPCLFPSQIPLEANDRVQREPRGSGPQLPTPTHCVCRGRTRVAADPSPLHLPSVGGAPTCLPGRTASSWTIKHCLHGVMGRELSHYLFFFLKVLIGKAKSWQCQGSPYVALETPLIWVWRLPAGCVLPWPAHLCNEQSVLPPLREHTRSPQQANALPTPAL